MWGKARKKDEYYFSRSVHRDNVISTFHVISQKQKMAVHMFIGTWMKYRLSALSS